MSLDNIIKSSLYLKNKPKSLYNVKTTQQAPQKAETVCIKISEYNYDKIRDDVKTFESITKNVLDKTNTEQFILFIKWQYPNHPSKNIIEHLEQIGIITPAKKHQIESILSKYSLLKILRDIPVFVGSDGRSYRVQKHDIVTIPLLNAKQLIKKKVAVEMNGAALLSPKQVTDVCSQRDTMKIIRTSIQSTPGTTKQIEDHAAEQGISQEVFQSAITQMKKEGSIFETKDGILKCI